MSRFSAPINPERPRGAPSCAKCERLDTSACYVDEEGVSVITGLRCDLGHKLEPCADFRDASVERTERRGLKQGYDVVRVA